MKSSILIVLSLFFATSSFADDSGTPASSDYNYSNKDYHITYHNLPNTQVISFTGEILPFLDSTQGLKQVEARLIQGKNIDLLISASNGGSDRQYGILAAKLRNACPKGSLCKITTYVTNSCGSACVDLFLTGDRRVISNGAIFGFHREYAGIGPVELPIESRDSMVRDYADKGVDKNWLKANIDQLTSNQRNGVWVDANNLKTAGFAGEIDSKENIVQPFDKQLPSDFHDTYYPMDDASTFVSK